jgi:hypothetical protein
VDNHCVSPVGHPVWPHLVFSTGPGGGGAGRHKGLGRIVSITAGGALHPGSAPPWQVGLGKGPWEDLRGLRCVPQAGGTLP